MKLLFDVKLIEMEKKGAKFYPLFPHLNYFNEKE